MIGVRIEPDCLQVRVKQMSGVNFPLRDSRAFVVRLSNHGAWLNAATAQCDRPGSSPMISTIAHIYFRSAAKFLVDYDQRALQHSAVLQIV